MEVNINEHKNTSLLQPEIRSDVDVGGTETVHTGRQKCPAHILKCHPKKLGFAKISPLGRIARNQHSPLRQREVGCRSNICPGIRLTCLVRVVDLNNAQSVVFCYQYSWNIIVERVDPTTFEGIKMFFLSRAEAEV